MLKVDHIRINVLLLGYITVMISVINTSIGDNPEGRDLPLI